ncbi:MAG: PepSY-associated TM helix domain-containing protein [Hyphomicrobiaceae bacterium]|nr:PepSY-associated TM helix domain-containing protein [Hyphomicrobiaceae bacterium]
MASLPQTEARRRKRQIFKPHFVRAMLAGHSALGLAFAWLIYVVCLTGTLSVFLFDLQRWEQPHAPIVDRAPSPELIDRVVRTAYAKALAEDAVDDISIRGPDAVSPRLLVSFDDHEKGTGGNWLADREGNLVVRLDAPWTAFLAKLHINLHLPRTWGMFLVGLTGVALLSSLVSGLLSHPRIFKDAFALRWGGAKRLEQADLHNRLGVWGLPFHIAVSLTGALLGLATLIVGVLALAAYDGDSGKAFALLLGPRAGADAAPAPLPDVAAMIRRVQAQHPEARFARLRMEHAATAGQIVHLEMRRPGHLALGNAYYFDGQGRLLGDGGYETGSIGRQILAALAPLHFGWFGGSPVKIVYGLLGLALTVITHSGVVIWLARRRDAGRPAPLWESLWAAGAWSQPLALILSAAVSLAGYPAAILPAYAATLLVSLILATAVRSGPATTRALCAPAALAALGLVAAHVGQWRAHAFDASALAINAALLACAAALLLRAGSRRPRPAAQAGFLPQAQAGD